MSLTKVKSDYTAVVKDEFGTHIIRCKIKDETHLFFQVGNEKNESTTPCYLIPANYGVLPYYPSYEKGCGMTKKEWSEFNKEQNNYFALTKNVNRQMLVGIIKLWF